MHYLIDGHNLIGKMPEIGLDHPAKELRLIERLMQFCSRRQRDSCAIVFDRGLPGGRKPRLGNSQVKVSFAHSATNADRLIMVQNGRLIDDGDAAYADGGFTVVTPGYLGDARFSLAGSGQTATWTFNLASLGLPATPGVIYRVSATWPATMKAMRSPTESAASTRCSTRIVATPVAFSATTP